MEDGSDGGRKKVKETVTRRKERREIGELRRDEGWKARGGREG